MFELGLTEYIVNIAYITCIVVSILALFYKAKIGLYLIVFLIPLQNLLDRLVSFPFGKDILDILIIATLLGSVIQKNRKEDLFNDKSMLYPVVFLFLSSYSSLWVGYVKLNLPMPISYESNQLIQWKCFITLPVLYYITIKLIKDKREIILIIWIMVISVFLMDVYFYNNSRWIDFSHYSDALRKKTGSTFTYLGPNELATFFCQMSMFMLGFFLLDKLKIRKLVFLCLVLFSFYCILYLFSRGAYTASLVGLLFLGLIQKRTILLLIIIFALSWNTVLPQSVLERIEMTRTEEGGLESSAQSRVDMWSKAVDAIKLNPVTGIGFGGTEYLGIKNDTSGVGVRRNIHNGYLAVLIEQGFIGLFAILYIFYLAFKRGLNLFKKSGDYQFKGIGLGIMAMIVANMVDNLTGSSWTYLNVMGYFWVIMGLTMKAAQFEQSNKIALNNSCVKA